MAQQYTGIPPYGVIYPPAPQYPAYNPIPTQTMPHSSAGFHQQHVQTIPSQTPVMQANDLRFHANMQAASQPATFPFPAPLSADMLKHFPPPPPPPPPPAFPSGPGTPVSFSQLPQNMNNGYQSQTQHVYPHAIGVPTTTPSVVSQTSLYNPAVSLNAQVRQHGSQHQVDHAVSTSSLVREPYDTTQHLHEHTMSDNPRGAGSSDNRAQTDNLPLDGWESNHQTIDHVQQQHLQHTQNSSMPPSQQARLRSTSHQPEAVTPPADHDFGIVLATYAELREQAKAAILSLASHKVTYDDFVVEGIDPQVLELLFSELGLELSKNSIIQDAQMTTETSNGHVRGLQSQANVKPQPPMKLNIVPGPAASQSLSATLAVERKDRIAQLLAAKVAKNNPAGAISPSSSPASASGADLSQKIGASNANGTATISTAANTLEKKIPSQGWTTSQLVQQQLAILRQTGAPAMQPSPPDLSSVLNRIPLSTPVRESLVENGLSTLIPGLFMSNDEEESSKQEHVLAASAPTQDLETLPLAADSVHDGLGQKRPASPLPMAAGEERSTKRRVSSVSGRGDIEMELEGSESGEASEGEIVEFTSPPQDRDSQHRHPREGKAQLTNHMSVGEQISHRQARDTNSMDNQSRNTVFKPMTSRTRSFLSSPAGSTPTTPAAEPPNQSSSKYPLDFPRSETGATKMTVTNQRPISKLTPAQLAERAAQLKADLVRQRRIRQQQLSEGMPALDDKVLMTQQRIARSRQRLDAIRAELQKYETEVARARDDEQQILIEIERLEKQLQEGVTGQTQFSEELVKISRLNEGEPSSIAVDSQHHPEERPMVSSSFDSVKRAGTESSNDSEATNTYEPGQSRSETPEVSNLVARHGFTEPEALGVSGKMAVKTHPKVLTEPDPHSNERTTFSPGMLLPEPQKSEAEPVNADVASDNVSDHSMEQVQTNDEVASECGDSRMSIDNESDANSDGSASMSDSGSDDYEPAEPDSGLGTDLDPRSPPERHRDDSEEYDPEDTLQAHSHTEAIADDYEPSEPVGKGDSDVAPNQFETKTNNQQIIPMSDRFEQDISGLPIVISRSDAQPSFDDRETDLQLAEANNVPKGPEHTENNNFPLNAEIISDTINDNKPIHFVPYQSPLSSFKSYRFHPLFTERVQTGFRSLTYSNKIDPKIPICPSELAGRVCSDPDCQEQHFGSMILTDDKILVQMSSAHDISDKNLRDEFLLGLKQVIASLRQNGVKEFSQVAAALSKYRRDWSTTHSSI